MDQILRDRTSDIDELVVEVVGKSRAQFARVDQLFTDLVQRVETTSDLMQRRALAPLNEVSAIVKGLRAGFDFFFSRQRSNGAPSETAGQDEQLFI